MQNLRIVIAIAGLLVPTFSVNAAAEVASPFVAGFERFARHGEIETSQTGQLLLTELSCTACHATKVIALEPKRGPRLTGAGNRLQADWIKQFLASPQKIKPGATMPDMFAGWPDAEKTRAIQSLAAFLETQRQEFPEIKGSGLNPVPFEFWNKGNPLAGKQLYHQIGCVACHAADANYETVATKPSALDQLLEQLDPQELAELGLSGQARRVDSVPLGDLAAKYTQQSLTFFLLDPEQIRPAGRMPNFKLAAVEAADIAAYLLREQQPNGEVASTDASDQLIPEGRRLFESLGCINCHEVTRLTAKPQAKPLEELNPKAERSCLATPQRGVPSFPLDPLQIEAIQTALMGTRPAGKSTVEDELEFQLLQLNCHACHERDNRGGVGRFRKPFFETVGHVDIGDEGRLPPTLSGVGAKLQSAWINQVLKGAGVVRPHMRIRMPMFPAKAVKPLPALFAKVDQPVGQQPSETETLGKLDGLAESGRVLLDNGCVECHAFRGEALPGVLGVDLEGITTRVQPRWFHDFLLDPGKLKPRTRMPTFFPNGISQNKTVLAGDADRQIAAMWAYLKELDKQPLPEKIERIRSQNYELKPADRPIVLRCFMKEAGTHAIAVGFPEKVHFAFDAETSRVAGFWRGRFLDAQGTWFSRFTPPADPLGDDFVPLPEGLPFAILKNNRDSWPKLDLLHPAYRYLGYRLDAAGAPTFLYRYDRFDIEDRILPEGEKDFTRRLTIKNRKPQEKSPELWFRPMAGKAITFNGEWGYTNDKGLAATITKGRGRAGAHRQTHPGEEWILPLEITDEKMIEVHYAW